MIDLGKKNLLGVRVDAIDCEAAVARVIDAALRGEPLTLSALAVHGVMTGVLDRTHRYRLNHLDLAVPDGQAVRWGLNWLHRTRLAERVYGPALMLAVCEKAAERCLPIYLYGSGPPVLEELQVNLRRRIPSLAIAGAAPSLFRTLSAEEKQEVAGRIRASGARIAFVGLGCPRQEVWAYEHREVLAMPVLSVGAAFDFHARTLAQAPRWMQRAGLEWFFRLAHEPRRLWKRYLIFNPLYLCLLFLQRAGLHGFDPSAVTPPAGEIRPG